MIKRSYFMHARKNKPDGSFRYEYLHFYHRSWFEESFEAFKYGLSEIEKATAHIPGDMIEVMCFTRC